MNNKVVAIVLAAGQGKRMHSEVAKQYLKIKEKPILFYTLRAFEKSNVDEIVLVTGKGEEEYCRESIVRQYGFTKVSAIVCGGKERYDSVFEGLKVCKDTAYVLIHDGARPCISPAIINHTIEQVFMHKACIVAVPVKDTIKRVDQNGVVQDTIHRDELRIVQTPQAFDYNIIRNSYEVLMQQEHTHITDDAMVVETVSDIKVHVVEGSYMNIKVTTPEDLHIIKEYLNTIDLYE